ncbi:MAG: glutamate synthase, partial [Myxococcaceae bacterium]|nr:glutamate synthase [Myxococcaceae bacterium]
GLQIDPRGFSVLGESHAAGTDGVLALCVHSSSLERHRRELSAAGLPFGVRMDEAELERALTTALEAGADFVILDVGRAALAVLAKARLCLRRIGAPDGFAIILDGELRLPNDFIKALALGASGLMVASSTLGRILALPLASEVSSRELVNHFLVNTLQLITIMARACGHDRVSQFGLDDLTTWLPQVAAISGVACSGYTHFQ